MSVKEAKLYNFLKENETGIFYDRNTNVAIAYVHVNHLDVQKFIEIVGSDWLVGGCDVKLFEHTFVIDLNDIIESFGQLLEDYKDCFNENDWNEAFGAKTCCCCQKTCYTQDGASPTVVFSGKNYNKTIYDKEYICEECSIDYKAYGCGFIKRQDL